MDDGFLNLQQVSKFFETGHLQRTYQKLQNWTNNKKKVKVIIDIRKMRIVVVGANPWWCVSNFYRRLTTHRTGHTSVPGSTSWCLFLRRASPWRRRRRSLCPFVYERILESDRRSAWSALRSFLAPNIRRTRRRQASACHVIRHAPFGPSTSCRAS